MKSFAAAFACLALAAAPAWGADYDATEKSPLYELHLRVPATAMTIAPLKDKILALYKTDADQAKSDAKDDKEGNPSFSPYNIDTIWRVSFENDAVLSLSAETNADTGAAHPNQAFQTLVWDRKANRAVPLEAGQHETQEILIAANDRALLDEIVHQAVGVVRAFAPESGTRRDETNDSALVFYDDGAQIVDVLPAHAFAQA